jgi:hypothetical protein
MNGSRAVRKQDIGNAVARGVCPLCTLLRHRQTQLVEETGVPNAERLCNYHAWSLARSAPASLAAEIFLHTLHARESAGMHAGKNRCDFCELLIAEEESRIAELLQKMRVPSFLEWMRVHGTLCLRHADRLMAHLAPKDREIIAELLARTAGNLEEDLAAYAKHAQQGAHNGGGVLGRAAEFLVSQRGIPSEEAPC